MPTLSAAELTRRQELTSAWIFKRALNDNIPYNSWQDILTDEKFQKEVLDPKKGIYPEVADDKAWLNTFYLQQKEILTKLSKHHFTEFTREEGFMDYISNIVRTRFGISKKDSWNPADIWCIKNEQKVMGDITQILRGHGFAVLEELNAYLRTLFEKEIVVGISLKKISGKEAHYEIVNVDELQFEEVKKASFPITYVKIDLSLEKKKGAMTFGTQDTDLRLEAIDHGKKVLYKMQIKASGTSDFNNLKFEPTSSLGTSARLGKVPLAEAADQMKQFGMSFQNNHNIYPKTASEFMKKSKTYSDMFAFIQRHNVQTVIKTKKDFVDNMLVVFANEPHLATSKLMQITFLYELYNLPKNDVDKIMTNFVFLAQKKGRGFGPFGKLY